MTDTKTKFAESECLWRGLAVALSATCQALVLVLRDWAIIDPEFTDAFAQLLPRAEAAIAKCDELAAR